MILNFSAKTPSTIFRNLDFPKPTGSENLNTIVSKIKAGMLVEVEFFTDTVMKSEKYSEKSSFRKIVPTVFAEKFRMMKHKPYEWFKMI